MENHSRDYPVPEAFLAGKFSERFERRRVAGSFAASVSNSTEGRGSFAKGERMKKWRKNQREEKHVSSSRTSAGCEQNCPPPRLRASSSHATARTQIRRRVVV
ncbi:hypothetical protein KM043_004847 [Ampulex compressa]|nr:hypothetical protein KM043_004847 [Ampulex compressa]